MLIKIFENEYKQVFTSTVVKSRYVWKVEGSKRCLKFKSRAYTQIVRPNILLHVWRSRCWNCAYDGLSASSRIEYGLTKNTTMFGIIIEAPVLQRDSNPAAVLFLNYTNPVSYTHLDVYKRQKQQIRKVAETIGADRSGS